MRGGDNDIEYSGIFYFGNAYGYAIDDNGFRVILIV